MCGISAGLWWPLASLAWRRVTVGDSLAEATEVCSWIAGQVLLLATLK